MSLKISIIINKKEENNQKKTLLGGDSNFFYPAQSFKRDFEIERNVTHKKEGNTLKET